MRKFYFLSALAVLGAMFFASCSTPTVVEDVDYELAENYFFNNKLAIPESPIITSQAQLDSLYGGATTMGKGGTPTEIDFEDQFAIGIVMPDTNDYLKIIPGNLSLANDTLTLHYTTQVIETDMSWVMQPTQLIVVKKKYQAGACRLIKDE